MECTISFNFKQVIAKKDNNADKPPKLLGLYEETHKREDKWVDKTLSN